MTDFKDINYLKNGNWKQKKVFEILTKYNILEKLCPYKPILVGTIPIEIDTVTSDLDIICHFKNKTTFSTNIENLFSSFENFKIKEKNELKPQAVVARFKADGFDVEIFGQNLPTEQQNAYIHMITEHKILQKKGKSFRKKIIALKKRGIKTEPAFALELGLEGNPYEALLNYAF